MRQASVVALVMAVASVGNTARAQSNDDDVVAAARPDLPATEIGRLYTDDFRPVTGPRTHLYEAEQLRGHVTEQARQMTSHERRVVGSEAELRANARAWGIAEVAAGLSAAQHHAYFRAYEIVRSSSVDASQSPADVPADAAWYVSEVSYGWMVETHFQSRTQRFEGSGGISFPTAGGSVSAFAASNNLSHRVRTTGLVRTAENAEILFTDSEESLRSRFVPGDPQPILVRFTRVIRSAAWSIPGVGALDNDGGTGGTTVAALVPIELAAWGAAATRLAPGQLTVPTGTRGNSEITQITVAAGAYVDRIALTFRTASGSTHLLAGGGPGGNVQHFQLNPGEHIIEISGRIGRWFHSIQFTTDRGRQSPMYGGAGGRWFGGGGGRQFSLRAPPGQFIVGLVVRHAGLVDRVHAIYAR